MNLDAVERAYNALREISRDRGAFYKMCEEFGKSYGGAYDPSREIQFVDACVEAFDHLTDFERRKARQEIIDAASTE